MDESLRGRLLIAAPSLYDYFRRTVVLVIEHNEDGAMGVVLNRTSETLVGEVVPALAELADADELVRVGGPVSPDAIVALGEFGDPSEAGAAVIGGLGTLDPERSNGSLVRLRVYAGYAGWSAGQLEQEIAQNAWLTVEADADVLFETPVEARLPAAMRLLGIDFSRLSDSVGHA